VADEKAACATRRKRAAADAGGAHGRPSTARSLAAEAAGCSELVDRHSLRRSHLGHCPSPSCLRPSVDCPRSVTRRQSASTAAPSHTDPRRAVRL